ncbi:hypothetical protein V5E97_05985 [Singulisphaera sp. Ch08]|uniref:Uncharacterized protein n=1 Tax=Singulisphaera sp. Ch08 TaxID=3120278 RepID=A0AAU7CKF4_9BACT
MHLSFHRVIFGGVLAGLCVLTQGSAAMGQGQLLGRRPPQSATNPPTHLGEPILDKIAISVAPNATGDALKLQQQIAEKFARQSFCPQQRKREYAWIAPRPDDGRLGLWLYGWSGNIADMTKTSDGWLVRIVVWPRFANGGHPSRRIENGLYAEEYQYIDGKLSFQQAILPKNPELPLCVTW